MGTAKSDLNANFPTSAETLAEMGLARCINKSQVCVGQWFTTLSSFCQP